MKTYLLLEFARGWGYDLNSITDSIVHCLAEDYFPYWRPADIDAVKRVIELERENG
jgi:hypothetical protein